jgi:uncharacterized Zn finger protein
MSILSQLTESDVRNWIGEPSFGRGEQYFGQGSIFNARRQGSILKAQCQGSHAQSYRVEITLGPQRIAGGSCSCPVGGGGHCKHAAALLLTWLHQPDAFQEVDDLETVLERRSKAELVVILRRIIDRYPDLETLLELPVAGEGKTVDLAAIRRQVAGAFHSSRDVWDLVEELGQLIEIGDDHAAIKDWRSAAAIYQTVAQGIVEHYDMVYDEEGELCGVLNDCVASLGQCLAETEDPAQREIILRALFDAYQWNVESGGFGVGDDIPGIAAEQATAEEKRQVAEWVREALSATGDTQGDGFRRRAYGGFLLGLELEDLDDEAFLRLCRETERWAELVDRLLALGRVDEAVAETRQREGYTLLSLADIFVSCGQGDLAESLVRERLAPGKDAHLVSWLKERAQQRGDLGEALTLAETLFWQQPGLAGYRELGELARPLGRWDDLRAAILSRLTDEQRYSLLTEIHLEEGEVDRALETLEQGRNERRGREWGWSGYPLRIRVALAAEESRPREAIRLYMEEVETLIAARGRDCYAAAAGLLIRLRDLYRRLDESAAWETLIANLREQHRRLHALQDEFTKAGL